MTLEKLLNILCEKGWEPFGKKPVDIKEYCGWERYTRYFDFYNVRINREDTICERPRVTDNYSLRDIVSRESGLWQFVCENRMVNVNETEVYYFWLKRKGTLDRGHYYLSEACGDIRTNNYEFRLIESALKDESELESFILDNIKVDG